jgi:hypothetical protein
MLFRRCEAREARIRLVARAYLTACGVERGELRPGGGEIGGEFHRTQQCRQRLGAAALRRERASEFELNRRGVGLRRGELRKYRRRGLQVPGAALRRPQQQLGARVARVLSLAAPARPPPGRSPAGSPPAATQSMPRRSR